MVLFTPDLVTDAVEHIANAVRDPSSWAASAPFAVGTPSP